MPSRSDSWPMITPPTPKPIVVSVKGRDAPPRATWNSACTAGKATTTDHMPTPPKAESSMEMPSRNQA